MEDIDKLDHGVKIDFKLIAIEHLINAWRVYASCDAALHRSVMGKLERAQARSAAALHHAELLHHALCKTERRYGFRVDDDDGFMLRAGDEP